MLHDIRRWIAYPLIAVALCLIAGLAAGTGPKAPEPDGDMTVDSFDAVYALETGAHGTLNARVTETIAVDMADDDRHGIVRTIPLRYESHTIGVSGIQVEGRLRMDGDAAPADDWRTVEKRNLSDGDDTIELRIGSDRTTLHEGRQEYRITYLLSDIALTRGDGAQELYLDVNGTGWGTPFGRVTASVQVPRPLADRLNGDTACYAGPPGSTRTCRTETSGTDPVDLYSKAVHLRQFETMTIAVGFAPGTFATAYTPTDHVVAGAVWLAVPPALALLALLIVTVPPLIGRYLRSRPVLVVDYEPPADIEPLVAAEVWGVPGRGLTAQLLASVVRGEARITTAEPAGSEASPGRERSSRRELTRLASSLRVDGLEELDDRWTGALMRGMFAGRSLHEPNLSASLLDRRRSIVNGSGQRYHGGGAGWFLPAYIALIMVAITCTLFAVRFHEAPLVWALTSTLVATLLLVAALYRTPTSGRLTPAGEATYQHLRGLERFMTMSEGERIAWLQGTATAPRVGDGDDEVLLKLYEPLLPYAVIFGLERSWARLIGEHHRAVPGRADWVAALPAVPLGDVVASLAGDVGERRIRGQAMAGVNHGISRAAEATGRSVSNAFQSAGDGGSLGGGWSGGGSSGGSSGGGSAGGGMGGGGGSSW